MAWLETKGNVFRIRFRFGGARHLLALHTSDKSEARESLAQFEANVRLIERGIISPPPETADAGVYIVSGGKLTGRPSDTTRTEQASLGTLFDRYLSGFPKAVKEASTWKTERIHIGHLRRLLDVRLPLTEPDARLTPLIQRRVSDVCRASGTPKCAHAAEAGELLNNLPPRLQPPVPALVRSTVLQHPQ